MLPMCNSMSCWLEKVNLGYSVLTTLFYSFLTFHLLREKKNWIIYQESLSQFGYHFFHFCNKQQTDSEYKKTVFYLQNRIVFPFTCISEKPKLCLGYNINRYFLN